MKVSRSVRYAMIAVEHIAKSDEQTVLAAQISKEYKIPLEYLLKILQQLVRANVLRSKRGPKGGFFLSKAAEDISLLEIYEAIEGTIVNDMKMIEQAPREVFSKKTEEIYGKAIDSIRAIFTDAKVSNLIV